VEQEEKLIELEGHPSTQRQLNQWHRERTNHLVAMSTKANREMRPLMLV
jgi:hypothetical protein